MWSPQKTSSHKDFKSLFGALFCLEKLVIIALEYRGKLHEQIDGRVIEAGFDLTERTGGNIDTEQI